MFYTYILKEKGEYHFYVGSTNDLKKRLNKHLKGENKYTKNKDWELLCYFAFKNEEIARDFEKYLKTGSGRAFSKRHFEF